MAPPKRRGTTASDGTIIKKPRTNLSMVAQQFIDAYKTAYISLKNNPGGRENLFKKILATAEIGLDKYFMKYEVKYNSFWA